jgi:hypothetical protein
LRWDLANFLPGLALNCDPPDLYLLSSWDYRCEPGYRLLEIKQNWAWGRNSVFLASQEAEANDCLSPGVPGQPGNKARFHIKKQKFKNKESYSKQVVTITLVDKNHTGCDWWAFTYVIHSR